MFENRDIPTLFRLFLLLMVVNTLKAQDPEVFHFNGPLTVNEFKGQAEYDYLLVGEDSVRHGPFRMQSSDLDALMEAFDKSFLFSGNFSNGFAQGPWHFEFGEFKTDNTTKVVDFQYHLNVSGVQNRSSGDLIQGKPDGKWVYSVLRIENSEVSDTLFQSRFIFEKGIPQRNFEVTNGEGTLVGRFLRDGLAHDVWVVYRNEDPEETEKWHFADGRLVKIEYGSVDKSEVIDIFKKPFDSSRSVGYDSRYLALIKLLQKRSRSDYEAITPRLLEENIGYYQKIDTLLSKLGSTSFLPHFKVKIPVIPLDSLAAAQLDSINDLTLESDKIATSLLKNTHLSILRRSDPEVNYLAGVLQKFDSTYLAPLKKLKAFHDLDMVGYLGEQEIIGELWPQGRPQKGITVVTQGEDGRPIERTYSGPRADTFDFKGDSLISILQQAKYLNLSLRNISDHLKDKLDQKERQQSLVRLEERMVTQTDGLIGQIDSTMTDSESDLGRALSSIKKNIENRLNEYSKLEEDSDKLTHARELIDCIDRFELLAKALIDLPEKRFSVEEKYHDRVWNPFTATLMDDVVKRRIVNAYRNILLPHILDRIRANIDCQQAKELESLLAATHARVAQLRDEDTERLERKLKRQRNPETIMELFNLDPNHR